MTIIEADVNVDFEAPLDHEDGLMGAAAKAEQEAKRAAAAAAAGGSAPPPVTEPSAGDDGGETSRVQAFSGAGFSLSGKNAPSTGVTETTYAAIPKPIEKCKGATDPSLPKCTPARMHARAHARARTRANTQCCTYCLAIL
jgi:hypothetical protein